MTHLKKLSLVGILFLCSLAISAQTTISLERSTPEAEGISSEAILSFVELAEKEIDAIHSFMILRHGKVISEGWWDPYGSSTPHVMHSLSKLFTSSAIGFAVQEGLLSLDDKVISFFPEETPSKPGWQLNALRIRQLLTMDTGHIQEPSWSFLASDNWVKTFLDSKFELSPGTHFVNNSAASHMLSAILQKESGQKMVDFLEPRLFKPLGIKKPYWESDPQGINKGGWGLHITTEDIAKLGQLYLQKGNWNGKQLLKKEWVDMATSRQVSNGSDPDNDWNQGYGFQFWISRHGFRGDGAAGQFCLVIPEHDIVVAITAGTGNMGAEMELVWNILLPAAKDKALPENPQAYSELEQKTASLKLKPVEGDVTNPLAKKTRKKKFAIPTNEQGVKSIAFDLGKKKNSITIEMEHGIEVIPIGSGEFIKSDLKKHVPYTEKLVKNIAASGAWIAPDQYQLKMYHYGAQERLTYTFRFKDDEVVWNSKLEFTMFGPRTQSQLLGKSIK